MKFLWLLACIGAARAALVAPHALSSPTARATPRRAAAAFVTMEDKPQYSREVQMKAEMESPLQQARCCSSAALQHGCYRAATAAELLQCCSSSVAAAAEQQLHYCCIAAANSA